MFREANAQDDRVNNDPSQAPQVSDGDCSGVLNKTARRRAASAPLRPSVDDDSESDQDSYDSQTDKGPRSPWPRTGVRLETIRHGILETTCAGDDIRR